MGYYANQKTLTINKPSLTKDDIKVLIKRETLEAAARNLTGNEFKLYMYLASNADGYELDFAPKFFKRDYGVGEDTARKCMKNLEEKGYLVVKDGFECLFDFYLEPQKKIKIQPQRRRIIDDNGEVFDVTYSELCEELEKANFTKKEIDEIWNEGEVL